jgi:hypothetical protein
MRLRRSLTVRRRWRSTTLAVCRCEPPPGEFTSLKRFDRDVTGERAGAAVVPSVRYGTAAANTEGQDRTPFATSVKSRRNRMIVRLGGAGALPLRRCGVS